MHGMLSTPLPTRSSPRVERLETRSWHGLRRRNSYAQLTILMAQLGLACKATSRACAKAGIAGLFGMAGEQNSSGDDQKKVSTSGAATASPLVRKHLHPSPSRTSGRA